MILVAYKHALRASETASLTLDDLKDGCLDIRRKKGSLHTIQPLFPHKGEPLLDEVKAIRVWLLVRMIFTGPSSPAGTRLESVL